MNEFPKIKDWINENDQNGVSVLLPGGFKPMTGAHLELIRRYAENPIVKEVKVIVGPKERNGINQELGTKIAKELTKRFTNVKVEKSKYPSPLLTAYKEVENMLPGKYALAASAKGDDYKRVMDFTAQHQEGGKYHPGVPEGVTIVELPIDVDPALFQGGPLKGEPISASILRRAILDGDFDQFASGYPDSDSNQVEDVWDMLQGVVNESYNIVRPNLRS